MKMTSMNIVPMIAVSTVMMAALAAANVRSRNSRRSKSGTAVRSSHQTQTARIAAAAAKRPSIVAERPAPVVALDDRQREAEEAGGDEADAGPVERRARAHRRGAGADERERQHDAECADRDVEPEDGRPAPASR